MHIEGDVGSSVVAILCEQNNKWTEAGKIPALLYPHILGGWQVVAQFPKSAVLQAPNF